MERGEGRCTVARRWRPCHCFWCHGGVCVTCNGFFVRKTSRPICRPVHMECSGRVDANKFKIFEFYFFAHTVGTVNLLSEREFLTCPLKHRYMSQQLKSREGSSQYCTYRNLLLKTQKLYMDVYGQISNYFTGKARLLDHASFV